MNDWSCFSIVISTVAVLRHAGHFHPNHRESWLTCLCVKLEGTLPELIRVGYMLHDLLGARLQGHCIVLLPVLSGY